MTQFLDTINQMLEQDIDILIRTEAPETVYDMLDDDVLDHPIFLVPDIGEQSSDSLDTLLNVLGSPHPKPVVAVHDLSDTRPGVVELPETIRTELAAVDTDGYPDVTP
jgi:hypothetical protein